MAAARGTMSIYGRALFASGHWQAEPLSLFKLGAEGDLRTWHPSLMLDLQVDLAFQVVVEIVQVVPPP
jgi:hypothetical protein